MQSAITLLLSLIGNLAPLAGGTSSTVGIVISTLTQAIPTLIQEYQDVAPFVKNIISALKNDPAVTQSQLDALDALDKQVDDVFDAALAKAQEEDKT